MFSEPDGKVPWFQKSKLSISAPSPGGRKKGIKMKEKINKEVSDLYE